jgi:hypothetical protein
VTIRFTREYAEKESTKKTGCRFFFDVSENFFSPFFLEIDSENIHVLSYRAHVCRFSSDMDFSILKRATMSVENRHTTNRHETCTHRVRFSCRFFFTHTLYLCLLYRHKLFGVIHNKQI